MPNPNLKPEDVLGMSDEDFLNNPPVFENAEGGSTQASSEQTQEEEDTDKDTPTTKESTTTENGGDGTSTEEEDPTNGEGAGTATATETDLEKQKEKNKDGTAADLGSEKSGTEEKKTEPEKKVVESTEPDYKSFYDQIMAPFKANGKMIEVRSPDEALALMKMGANYTKKMQGIQEHKKLLMMLDKNQLLDEAKLSYLIDLSQKNPDAIKKLVKDAGIDPMDIDTSVEPTYVQGNHRVSDEESNFKTQLEELGSTPEGQETLRVINTDWDQPSKESLWTDPQLMDTIHKQRESGIYGLITAEVDRQKTLGNIPANVPFIQAYQVIGKHLHEQGAFAALTGKAEKKPVDVKAATPKNKVANGTKASAAAPSRSTPNKTTGFINPLSQNDDEFMKQFANRV